jgi:hypothetical protein
MKNPGERYGDRAVPGVNRHLAHRSDRARACDVVVQNIETAESIDGELHHRFDLSGLADVDPVKYAGGTDLAGDAFTSRLVDVGDNYRSALGGEQPRRGGSDT